MQHQITVIFIYCVLTFVNVSVNIFSLKILLYLSILKYVYIIFPIYNFVQL